MKTREPRRKVMIPARFKAASGWRDACILNVSSRGAMVYAPDLPSRGEIVELRRGQLTIMARVMWRTGGRCGVKTQELISVDQLLADPEAENSVSSQPSMGMRVDRRVRQRNAAEAHDASRRRGRLIEYGFIGALVMLAAGVLVQAVASTFSRPLAATEAALVSAQ